MLDSILRNTSSRSDMTLLMATALRPDVRYVETKCRSYLALAGGLIGAFVTILKVVPAP
jgi:hypothetical protein